jgi:hypothetical protein
MSAALSGLEHLVFSRAVAFLAKQARQFPAGAKEQHRNAGGLEPERRGDLAVLGSFNVRQPQQHAFLRLEIAERPRHSCFSAAMSVGARRVKSALFAPGAPLRAEIRGGVGGHAKECPQLPSSRVARGAPSMRQNDSCNRSSASAVLPVSR